MHRDIMYYSVLWMKLTRLLQILDTLLLGVIIIIMSYYNYHLLYKSFGFFFIVYQSVINHDEKLGPAVGKIYMQAFSHLLPSHCHILPLGYKYRKNTLPFATFHLLSIKQLGEPRQLPQCNINFITSG